MSSSDRGKDPLASIEAHAPVGVEINILDSTLSTVATGLEHLSLDVSPGIYTIRWVAGEQMEQQVVRVREGGTASVDPETLVPGAAYSENPDLSARQFERLRAAVTVPMEARTEIALFVCANDSNTTSDVASSVELREIDPRSGIWRRRVPALAARHDVSEGWSLVRFEVKPGPYILRFLSTGRTRLEQCVYAPPRRRSLAWLRYGRASTTERHKGDARIVSRRGVEQSRSRFLSFAGESDPSAFERVNLLGDVLIHQLTARTGTLDPTVVAGLDDYDDPYLRLYAACVFLARPSEPSEDWPSDPARSLSVPERNLAVAKQLLAPLLRDRRLAGWPDLLCARWRIALAERVFDNPALAEPLPAPPMLEAAWRWATAWSAEHPIIDPERGHGLREMVGLQQRSTPWLSWRAIGGRFEPSAGDRSRAGAEASGDARETTGRAVPAAIELSRQVDEHRLDQLDGLVGPDTLKVLRSLLAVGDAGHWEEAGRTLINRLAGTLGLPMSALEPALESALRAVAQAWEQLPSPDQDPLTSDPHKGQFGGAAERDGLRVALAEIRPSNSPEFLGLTFEVESTKLSRPLDGVVTFYLHPTFAPDRVTAPVVDGKASYTCYAWGAFTLGVETQDGVRLELDVAQDGRLPRKFRDR